MSALRRVVIGADTHLDTNHLAVLTDTGKPLADAEFPTSPAGYDDAVRWAQSLGTICIAGVEGTSSYGAGLTRVLQAAGIEVAEVSRPDRAARRRRGKSDPLDAYAAARAALAGDRLAVPKDEHTTALRALLSARRSAVKAHTAATNQLHALLVTAPEPLRGQLRHLSARELIATCAALRPDPARVSRPDQAAKAALRSLASHHNHLTEQIAELDTLIQPLVTAINPRLLELNGVGADVAGQLLVTAGQNPDRIRSEAAFAMLCGVAPIPASSGQTHRHRLNRGGDRQANSAIHRIVICRLRWDPRTRAYMTRRTTEGLSKKDVIRCLKRLIARELYYALTTT